jgi:hypothetical protein
MAAPLPDPGPIVKYGASAKGGKGRSPSAIVNIETVMRDCEQGLGKFTVEQLDFDGASTRIKGFRAIDHRQRRHYFSLDPRIHEIANADRGALGELLREKRELIVTFQRCGSGGYLSVKDVYAQSAIDP